MKLLNFGSLNIDYVYDMPHFVQGGETATATARHVYAGGKGLNQSIAAARAGAQVLHAGAIGPDGAFLTRLLQDPGNARGAKRYHRLRRRKPLPDGSLCAVRAAPGGARRSGAAAE